MCAVHTVSHVAEGLDVVLLVPSGDENRNPPPPVKPVWPVLFLGYASFGFNPQREAFVNV